MCRWSRGIWGSARIVGPGPDRCWCRQEHFATFPGANTTMSARTLAPDTLGRINASGAPLTTYRSARSTSKTIHC